MSKRLSHLLTVAIAVSGGVKMHTSSQYNIPAMMTAVAPAIVRITAQHGSTQEIDTVTRRPTSLLELLAT